MNNFIHMQKHLNLIKILIRKSNKFKNLKDLEQGLFNNNIIY